jgi:glycerol-3-phosphate dehydrogenase (NAD(P)+)
MARVLVLGAGVMGTAFTYPLSDAGHEVRLLGTHLDDRRLAAMRSEGRHPDVGLPLPAGVTPLPFAAIDEAFFPPPDLVVLGVSSPGIPWSVETLASRLPRGTPVLLLTKGLAAAGGRIMVLTEHVRQGLAERDLPDVPVGGVGGPCIAAELAARRDTVVQLAFEEPDTLAWCRSLLGASYYHVDGTTDVVGTEVCAALKNFYTLGVAAAAGRLERAGEAPNGAAMHNPAAGLFTRAVSEMARISAHLGGRAETVYGLAGVGDLYVTCQAGRNSRMGRLLGRGLTYRQARARHMPDDTVEGAELGLTIGPTIVRLMDENALEAGVLSLTRALLDALLGDEELHLPFEAASSSRAHRTR